MSRRKFTPEQETVIVGQYMTPLPDGSWHGATAIASQWGTYTPVIYGILRRHGIQPRSTTEAHANGKRCKPIKNLPPEGEPAPFCKCGCEQPVEWNRRKNRWNVYLEGHQRPDAPYKHSEWLRDAYEVKRMTLAEIAAQFNVNSTTILLYLERFGIPPRNRSESRIGRKGGDKNPAWKGGVTPERQRVYRTQEWLSVVKVVYERDHRLCQRCGSPKHPHAHHIKAWADYPELRLDPDNLVTLCEDCHTWVHSKENTDREYIG